MTDDENSSNLVWKDRGIKCLKYVDDCLSIEKINFRKRRIGLASCVKACKTQSHYETVSYNARNRGMKLNEAKTKMICVSAARSYKPKANINAGDNNNIETADLPLRVLGFYFGTEPNVKANMSVLQRKFKSRIWALRHLKQNGFKQGELVQVYKTMIRPVAEYCSSVFHALITKADSYELERIQMQALKVIFGWDLSYEKLMEMSGVEKLSVRREESFVKLAKKMSENKRFSSWFPLRLYRAGVDIRRKEKYKVYRASTGRCLNSPLNLMRRRLNEMQVETDAGIN